MQPHRQEGFSIVLKLVVTLLATTLLAVGWIILLSVINQKTELGAISTAESFISSANSTSADNCYHLLSPSLQQSNNSYTNLFLWLSEFKRNNITIETTPTSVNSGVPAINIVNFINSSVVVFKTNSKQVVRLNLTYKAKQWLVQDYTVS